MCDERERLIGFVYDEVDPVERRAIEAHLAECPDCRQEVAGLRHARQDLLAWDVPAHEPVWRPMPPARPVSGWQQVPAWALAMAASAVLAAGLAGAMAARWLAPAVPPAVAVAAPAMPAPVPVARTTPAFSAEDVAAIEARVLARLREEMRGELRAASASQAPAAAGQVLTTRASMREDSLDVMTRRLVQLEQWRDEQDEWRRKQIEANWSVNNRIAGLNTLTRSLGDDWEYTRAQLQRVNVTSGPSFGR